MDVTNAQETRESQTALMSFYFFTTSGVGRKTGLTSFPLVVNLYAGSEFISMPPKSSNPEPALSRRERQIMDILYARARASAAEIQESLPDNPSNSTVRT